MIPNVQQFVDEVQRTYSVLGKGAFGAAYLASCGTKVIKVTREMDGTGHFIQWCYHRMQKYGKGSPEMDNLPEVEAFATFYCERWGDSIGWVAIMPRYECMRQDHAHGSDRWKSRNHFVRSVKFKQLEQLFGQDAFNDINPGNTLWDPERNQVILTDPSSIEHAKAYVKYQEPLPDVSHQVPSTLGDLLKPRLVPKLRTIKPMNTREAISLMNMWDAIAPRMFKAGDPCPERPRKVADFKQDTRTILANRQRAVDLARADLIAIIKL